LVYTDRFISWLEEKRSSFVKQRLECGGDSFQEAWLTEMIEGIGTLQKEKKWNGGDKEW
jgi:hypothetical protein